VSSGCKKVFSQPELTFFILFWLSVGKFPKFPYTCTHHSNETMKILHTADWHLGKRLESFSRHEEQVTVLNDICTIADSHNVDVVIIAGDLFDTYNPPNESVELFYKICKKLTNNGLRPVIAIAGNHDSPERIEAPDPLARECGIIFAGFPSSTVAPFVLSSGIAVTHSDAGFISLTLPNSPYPLHLLLTPFANEERLKRYLGDTNREATMRDMVKEMWQKNLELCQNTDGTSRNNREGVVILMAHLLFLHDSLAPVQEDEGEKPIYIGTASAFFPEDVPDGVQYVALGHLHRHHFVNTPVTEPLLPLEATLPVPPLGAVARVRVKPQICYSGSPLAYSFNEDNQSKYVVIIDAEPAKPVKTEKIKLDNAKKLVKIVAHDMVDALVKLMAVPDALVQLSISTDNALDRSIIQPLMEAHKGIVPPIIPIFTKNTEGGSAERTIDLDNLEKMFLDYFRFKHGSEPTAEVVDLFKEILANDE
jgi:DNA repair protein SbcD/Mre11